MTKLEYLDRVEKIVDTIEKITKNVSTLTTSETIQILRLQFDILTATYNCTKEDNTND